MPPLRLFTHEASLTDQRTLFRNAGLSVLAGVRKDDREIVASALHGDLAMADAIAMGGMAGGPHGKHARLGLALEAILADAPNALHELLASPAWLAARLDGGSDAYSWVLLSMAAAAKNERSTCAASLLARWPQSAWALASMSSPFFDFGQADAQFFSARRGAAGWIEGLEMSCAAIAASASPITDKRMAATANETIIAAHKGARGIPKSDSALRILSAIHGPSELLIASGTLSSVAAQVLMESAIHPLPRQRENFELAMSSWHADPSLASLAGIIDHSAVGASRHKFSLDRRGRSANGLTAIFPESVSVAWAAASHASAQSLSLCSIGELFATASAMAALHGAEGEQAMMAPQTGFAGAAPPHPLSGIWRDWNNSRRAGFAMGRDILLRTQAASKGQMERWDGLVDNDKITEWKTVFSTVMGKLISGHVPESFPGYPQAPDLRAESILPESALSPLAWRFWLDDNLSSDDVAAIAVFQSAAGFSLGSSILQISQMGLGLPPSHAAAAEAAILELSTLAPAPRHESARSLRI